MALAVWVFISNTNAIHKIWYDTDCYSIHITVNFKVTHSFMLGIFQPVSTTLCLNAAPPSCRRPSAAFET